MEPQPETSQTPQLEGEALREAIKKQVEFYLSRENLASDTFLVSQMNHDMFVPISTIAGFKLIKQLTTDETLIADVMKESSKVVVDETGKNIKPNIKLARNTIILRDLPTNIPVEEVTALFQNDEKCGKPTSVRADINETWFITFDSEEVALETLDALRGKTLHELPIKARLKSENLLRSFYYAPSAPNPYAEPTVPADPTNPYYHPQPTHNYRYSNYPYPQYGAEGVEGVPPQNYGRPYDNRGEHKRPYRNNNTSNPPFNAANPANPNANGTNRPQRNYGRKGQYNNSNATAPNGSNGAPNSTNSSQAQGHGNRDNDPNRKKGGRRTRKLSADTKQAQPPAVKENTTIQLGPAHFPPLAAAAQKTSKFKPGYAAGFKKYSVEDLVNVVSGLSITRPDDLPAEAVPALATASTELVITQPWPAPVPEPAPSAATTTATATKESTNSAATRDQPTKPEKAEPTQPEPEKAPQQEKPKETKDQKPKKQKKPKNQEKRTKDTTSGDANNTHNTPYDHKPEPKKSHGITYAQIARSPSKNSPESTPKAQHSS